MALHANRVAALLLARTYACPFNLGAILAMSHSPAANPVFLSRLPDVLGSSAAASAASKKTYHLCHGSLLISCMLQTQCVSHATVLLILACDDMLQVLLSVAKEDSADRTLCCKQQPAATLLV